MTRLEKPATLLPPRVAQGRRRARRFDRRAGHVRLRASRAMPRRPAAMSVAVKPPLTPDQLSSYIAVNADGTIAAYFGKMDMGHGIAVAIAQIVAEELDAPFGSVKMSMGDTATSVNQGGASGSTGIEEGGKQMRLAAAEARRVLVEMAADRLGVPVRSAHREGRRRLRQSRSRQEGRLCRIGRRTLFQRAARLERQDRQSAATRPARRKPKDPKDHRDRRPADQTRGCRAAASSRSSISSPTSKCPAWCTAA